MRNGNTNFGKVFTYALVIRGELEAINDLINFLNTRSDITVAHQEIGQEKMYIKKGDGGND